MVRFGTRAILPYGRTVASGRLRGAMGQDGPTFRQEAQEKGDYEQSDDVDRRRSSLGRAGRRHAVRNADRPHGVHLQGRSARPSHCVEESHEHQSQSPGHDSLHR